MAVPVPTCPRVAGLRIARARKGSTRAWGSPRCGGARLPVCDAAMRPDEWEHSQLDREAKDFPLFWLAFQLDIDAFVVSNVLDGGAGLVEFREGKCAEYLGIEEVFDIFRSDVLRLVG